MWCVLAGSETLGTIVRLKGLALRKTILGNRPRCLTTNDILSHCRTREPAICSAFTSPASVSPSSSQNVTIWGQVYPTDTWYNLSSTVSDSIGRPLHLQKDHPVSITRQIIESKFLSPTYKHYNNFPPVVSTYQNFDSLGFPLDHPGRSRADTYYINKETVLRTHTSAHQADLFRANESEGFLISADVYRRDAIDRNHFPVFHQMEGARLWDRSKVPNGDIVKAVYKDLEKIPKQNMKIEDPNPTFHADRNPLQTGHHMAAETEAVAAHLKRSLELVVAEVFSRARAATMPTTTGTMAEPLKIRWIEAYFPFTSPSWELEIFWQGDWLEVLGCGVVKQDLLTKAGVPDQIGWAFGVGLERIAMLLFDIPDIRLFWSKDQRFTNQFEGLSDNLDRIKRFSPFSKHPACYKDVAFWICSPSLSTSNGSQSDPQTFHENDLMELVRDIGGDLVENVTMVDEFTHPKTSRKSLCYRINYRSLERTLKNEEVNELHELVRQAFVDKLGVELR